MGKKDLIVVDPWRARPVKARGTKEGRRYWVARAYRDGSESSQSLGWCTRAEATKKLKRLDAPVEVSVTGCTTVADLLELWHGHVAKSARYKQASVSAYQYRAIAVKRGPAGIGPHPVGALLRGLLEDYAEDRAATAAPHTIAGELAAVQAAWTWARRRGYVPDKSLTPPKLIITPARDKYTPTAGDVAAVVRWLETSRAPWRADAVRVLWATGARVGELAGLPRARVDLEQGVATLDGKTGPRAVPLAPEAVAALRRLMVPHDGPTVLPGKNVKARKESVVRGIHRAVAALGQPRWTPHALRRAAADRLCRAGVSAEVAASMLGHSVLTMMKHYRQVTGEDRAAALLRADLGALPRGEVIEMKRRTE